jgi:hypothetical protein
MRDASRLALGVGIVGSLGAAVTGATDWQHTHGQIAGSASCMVC